MRLYRGIKEPYKSGWKRKGIEEGTLPRFHGTDFTDCPFAALQFAKGPRGSLFVLEIEADPLDVATSTKCRVTEEYWSPDSSGPRRLMVWGAFDEFIVAELPAKELRAQVRRRGIVGLPEADKAQILQRYIDDLIHAERGPVSNPL